MKKLFLFGDSVMKGVMYSEEKGKYTLCSDSRFDSYKDAGLDVSNCTRMGATIRTGRDFLERKLPEIDENSTVVFEYGGNDSDYNWASVTADPDGDHSPNTDEKEFVEIYSDMLAATAETGADVYMTTLVPINAENYMNYLSRYYDHDILLGWLGDVSMLYRWQEHYSTLTEKISARKNIKLIDIRAPFLLSHKFKNLLCADGIHPTEQGHALIKSIIKDAVTA